MHSSLTQKRSKAKEKLIITHLQFKTQRTQLYSEEWKEILVLSDQYNVDSKKATKTIQPTKILTTKNVSEGKVLMIYLTGKDILY